MLKVMFSLIKKTVLLMRLQFNNSKPTHKIVNKTIDARRGNNMPINTGASFRFATYTSFVLTQNRIKNLGLLFVSHLSRVLQGIILSRKEKQTNRCMTL